MKESIKELTDLAHELASIKFTRKKEKIEMILAEVIDDLYLSMKEDFVDYKNETHKLGWYKESVKNLFHEKIKNL